MKGQQNNLNSDDERKYPLVSVPWIQNIFSSLQNSLKSSPIYQKKEENSLGGSPQKNQRTRSNKLLWIPLLLGVLSVFLFLTCSYNPSRCSYVSESVSNSTTAFASNARDRINAVSAAAHKIFSQIKMYSTTFFGKILEFTTSFISSIFSGAEFCIQILVSTCKWILQRTLYGLTSATSSVLSFPGASWGYLKSLPQVIPTATLKHAWITTSDHISIPSYMLCRVPNGI